MPSADLALSLSDVTIGVVTALKHEYFAAYKVLGASHQQAGNGQPPRVYRLGAIPSVTGGSHVVAVTMLPGAGTHTALARVMAMQRDCPRLGLVVMCGIACAVPHPTRAEDHVRLGDLVICGREGVVHFQNVKAHHDREESRSLPRPPSTATLDAIGRLEASAEGGDRPWEDLIARYTSELGDQWMRPDASEDILQDDLTSPATTHPLDIKRRPAAPRVFTGAIASGNMLVANSEIRDRMRNSHNVRAIEMEGSGIADAAQELELQYQVVRGTSDYGNQLKNDRWQRYAALIAACFVRSLIENIPVDVSAREVPQSQLAEEAYADAVGTTQTAGGGRPSSEHLSSIGERLVEEVWLSVDTLEHAQAFKAAQELRDFIDTSRSRIPGSTVARWLETLVKVEVLRAQLSTSEGDAPDLSKAREYLKEAKDELERG